MASNYILTSASNRSNALLFFNIAYKYEMRIQSCCIYTKLLGQWFTLHKLQFKKHGGECLEHTRWIPLCFCFIKASRQCVRSLFTLWWTASMWETVRHFAWQRWLTEQNFYLMLNFIIKESRVQVGKNIEISHSVTHVVSKVSNRVQQQMPLGNALP